MNLFRQSIINPENLLPKEGTALYYGELLSLDASDSYFQHLLTNIAWKHDQAVINNQTITTKRKVAWYADQAFKYTYSKVTKQALPWTSELLQLKVMVEQRTGEQFNACLLNLYHDGNEGMAWHSDAEKDLKINGAIASLSFGAERVFSFKHKTTQEMISIILEHGSLLVMKGTTQQYWLHRLPPSKKITEPRINLTFRTISPN
ncbi:alpha-ketoglutarate-dependent dioxygenase AlkB [Psychromonas sp. RZ22]|uniref:alpha-ketoglutarate-dependent dioxygenase AlkB family protein n=1 Tax=Psychromonas algarum TaxID=2555643 RepID=UPI001068A1F6|nr:alpha-ketoglutarate-dependent dioxygenase AlkB [Psychromonas sp. RZ22]TEW53636.1 alpha-ketoglutarate-dependent dioxygenase AlkB [Psychromonas sp. RZ22]